MKNTGDQRIDELWDETSTGGSESSCPPDCPHLPAARAAGSNALCVGGHYCPRAIRPASPTAEQQQLRHDLLVEQSGGRPGGGHTIPSPRSSGSDDACMTAFEEQTYPHGGIRRGGIPEDASGA